MPSVLNTATAVQQPPEMRRPVHFSPAPSTMSSLLQITLRMSHRYILGQLPLVWGQSTIYIGAAPLEHTETCILYLYLHTCVCIKVKIVQWFLSSLLIGKSS